MSIAHLFTCFHGSPLYAGFYKYSILFSIILLHTCQDTSVVSDSLRAHGLYVAHQVPLSVGILQASISEWVTMLSSRGSSWPRDQISSLALAGEFFTTNAIQEALFYYTVHFKFCWCVCLKQPGFETLLCHLLVKWSLENDACHMQEHRCTLCTSKFLQQLNEYNNSFLHWAVRIKG